jgi:hypothetical protein
MNTRLKIICILLGVAYIVLIGKEIITVISPIFSSNFHEEFNNNLEQEEDNTHYNLYYVYVQPKEKKEVFPIQLKNLKDGTNINCSTKLLTTRITEPTNLPLWIVIARWVSIPILLFAFVLMIYIPITTYKLIKSIIKNNIFDAINLRRIHKIGYSLLLFFIISIYITALSTFEARELFELEDYKIVFSLRGNLYLLFGLATLLFGEILKISLKMKEENDLTV